MLLWYGWRIKPSTAAMMSSFLARPGILSVRSGVRSRQSRRHRQRNSVHPERGEEEEEEEEAGPRWVEKLATLKKAHRIAGASSHLTLVIVRLSDVDIVGRNRGKSQRLDDRGNNQEFDIRS